MQRMPVVFRTRHVNGPKRLVLPYESTRARGLNTVSPWQTRLALPWTPSANASP